MPPSKKTVTKPAVLMVEMEVPEDTTVNPFEPVLEKIKSLIGTDELPNVTQVYLGIDEHAKKAVGLWRDAQ